MAEKDCLHRVDIQLIFHLFLGSVNTYDMNRWFCIASLWFHYFSDKQKPPLGLFMTGGRYGSFRSPEGFLLLPTGEAFLVHSLLLEFCPLRMQRHRRNAVHPSTHFKTQVCCCCRLLGLIKDSRLGVTSCSHCALQILCGLSGGDAGALSAAH